MKKLLQAMVILMLASPAAMAQPVNALNFDGTDDMVVCGLPALFSNLTANDFTMEAWVYPTASVFSRIVYAQNSTTNFAAMSMGTGNDIYLYVIAGGTTYSVSTTASLPVNQWTHVAARWTAATNSVEVFFNGVLQAAGPGGSSSTGTSGYMTIGTRPGGAQYFPGSLDEVRVWSAALSQCQILANINRRLTGTEANLEAYYDFDHGTPAGNNAGVTTLTDYSGNGLNGTLANFALTGATSNWISSGAMIAPTSAVAGALALSGATYSTAEGAGSVTITVDRTGGSDCTVTVDYATSDGSAIAGSDYTASSGTVTLGPGVITQTFTVPIADDALFEVPETFTVTLSNPGGGATLGATTSAVVTITDNDVAPPSADLSITKTLATAGPFVQGQSIAYTLVVANAGPGAATNVQVTDTPTNLTITNVSGGGCSALPCTIPNLASGANATINVTATISAAGAFDNAANVSATESDANGANNIDNSGNGGAAAAVGARPIPTLGFWMLVLLGGTLSFLGVKALRGDF